MDIEEINSDLNVRKRSKNGFPNSLEYRREVIKRARVSGQAYKNYKLKSVPARTPGEDCRYLSLFLY